MVPLRLVLLYAAQPFDKRCATLGRIHSCVTESFSPFIRVRPGQPPVGELLLRLSAAYLLGFPGTTCSGNETCPRSLISGSE